MEQGRQRSTRTGMIGATALVIATTAILAYLGAAQAARHQRILGILNLPFAQLRQSGSTLIHWSLLHAEWIGVMVTALSFAPAVTAFRRARHGAATLAWMATAISFITWGEISVLADAIPRGCVLYGIGILAALVWGFRSPLAPAHPVETRSDAPRDPAPSTRLDAALSREWPIFLFLMLLTLVTRLYALTELPHEYESEMIISMLASRTLAGLLRYIPEGIGANTNGFAHLLPQWAIFQLLGTSVFSLRFVSVVCGLVCTALFYSLTRRLGGVYIAVVATLLFVTAPDQLFWSRQENTPFQFVTLLALIVASAGLRMVEGLSIRSVSIASITMPLARFFYGPAMVMMLYPPLLYAHSLLFSRATRRTLWYAIPLLVAGVGAWMISLSTASSLISGQPWRFINPTLSAGAPVWQGEGTFRNANLPTLLQLQAANLANNTVTVARAMTYKSGFTTWYRRADPSTHPTAINVAITVLLALGLAYLLGQLYEPRAFALLAWVGLEMLPALLSVDPVPRRMVGAFPGFYAVIAVTVGAIVQQCRAWVPGLITRILQWALGLALLLIAWANMASYFLLPMRPTHFDPLFAGTKVAFQRTDALFHNLGAEWALVLAFGHGDDLFANATPLCYEGVRPRDWLHTALSVTCPFESPTMTYSLSAERLAAARASYDPQQISFLLEDRPATARDLTLIRALFPDHPLVALPSIRPVTLSLHLLRTDRQTIEALRSPTLHPSVSDPQSEDLATRAIRDTKLAIGSPTEDASVWIEGSLLIDFPGWFRLAVEPACDAVELAINGEVARPPAWIPLTSGAHAVTLRLPTASACTLPLQITAGRHVYGDEDRAVEAPFVASRVATLPEARAARVVRSLGYREEPLPFLQDDTLVDFAVDERDGLTLLLKDTTAYRIERRNADGDVEASWTLPLDPLGISRAPDGILFVPYRNNIVDVFAADGKLISRWETPMVQSATLGHLADGSILSALTSGAIAVLDRKGHQISTWFEIEGEVKAFFEPWSAGATAKGDALIIQSDGTALLLRTPTDHFAPHLQRSFRIDFFETSVPASGWTFDEARDLIIVPDPSSRNILTFTLDGASVMASEPQHDLRAMSHEIVRRVGASTTAVYLLDGKTLRKLRPLDVDAPPPA